jgi:hypothetical protein
MPIPINQLLFCFWASAVVLSRIRIQKYLIIAVIFFKKEAELK